MIWQRLSKRQMLLQTRLARPINRKIETAAVVET
jgi:hypothetical protein